MSESTSRTFDGYVVLRTTSRPRRRALGMSPTRGVSWWSGKPITQSLSPLVQPLAPCRPWSGDESAYLGPVLNNNPPVWRDDFIAALVGAGVHNLQRFAVTVTSPPNTEALAALRLELAEAVGGDVDAYLRSLGYQDLQAWPDPVSRSIGNYEVINVLNPAGAPSAMMVRVEGTSTLLVHPSVQTALLAAGFGEDLSFDDPADVAH